MSSSLLGKGYTSFYGDVNELKELARLSNENFFDDYFFLLALNRHRFCWVFLFSAFCHRLFDYHRHTTNSTHTKENLLLTWI